MYLAGILALWALLHVPASEHVSSETSSFAPISAAFLQDQSPNQASPPQSQNSSPDQSQTNNSQTTPQQPAKPDATNPKKQASPKKPAASSKEHARKKKSTSPDQGPHKKVVHRGSTAEPTTQLTPGISQEQAAQQRQNTNQLLASTDESLQKLSGRQLTQDEQDTVTQIRKYMEQVKDADAAGDLPRAYKLAVKAHLLSDALAKP